MRHRPFLLSTFGILTMLACGPEPASDDDDDGSSSSSGAAGAGGTSDGGGGAVDTDCVLQKPELGTAYCADEAPDLWSCPPNEAPPDIACTLSALQGSYCCPPAPSTCGDYCTALIDACPVGDISFTACRRRCDEVDVGTTCDSQAYFDCAAAAPLTCVEGTVPTMSACTAELEAVLTCLSSNSPDSIQRNPSFDATCAETMSEFADSAPYRTRTLGYRLYSSGGDTGLSQCVNMGGGCSPSGCDYNLCCGLP